MKIHIMRLNPTPYKLIFEGEKTFEGRLFDEKRSLIEKGDIIRFYHEPPTEEFFEVEVLNLFRFNTFKEMAQNIPLEKLGFKGQSIEDAVTTYYNIYSPERERKYGVVAIEIKKI